MNAKKLILTGLSVFCFGASILAQDSRGKQEYKDGVEDEDHAVAIKIKTKDFSCYSRDVISLAPLQFTENGLGIGLAWEHSLDREGFVALELPLVMTMNPNNNNAYHNQNDMMYYAMPGLKFYPTGLGKVKYALGPSVVVGAGEKTWDNYDPYYSSYHGTTTESHFVLGMLINNSLNINPTPRMHLGLDFGMGFSYINRIGGYNDGMKFLTQGSFKVGYRF
jgi:hypothetical protein